MRDDDEILRTIHGSHLYGLAELTSDLDVFRVVRRRRRTLQTIQDNVDTTTMGLDRFLENVYTGAHQSCEALFSQYKVVHPHYVALFENYRVTGADAFDKYRRTITAFAHHETFKRRRHAVRLGFALHSMEKTGRFNPTMNDYQIGVANNLASEYTGQLLVDAISAMR